MPLRQDRVLIDAQMNNAIDFANILFREKLCLCEHVVFVHCLNHIFNSAMIVPRVRIILRIPRMRHHKQRLTTDKKQDQDNKPVKGNLVRVSGLRLATMVLWSIECVKFTTNSMVTKVGHMSLICRQEFICVL